jgi:DNA-binding GntR family transcriptional regulator
MIILSKNAKKVRETTLRERIYEEVVHLILSGELPSGGCVDEKQVIDKLRVSQTPFREAIGILAKGGLVEIKPYHGFFVRSVSRSETADLYELYKRLECFAVELAVPQMSDRNIRRFENILIEAVAALQRSNVKTYAIRDREFHEAIAEQSGNAALIEALRQFGLQIQLCGTLSNVNWEFAERTAHGTTTSYKHSRRGTLRALLFSSAHTSAARRRRFLRVSPMK